MRYHSIEKGLALKTPRPGFGAEKIDDLQRSLVEYVQRYGADEHSAVCLQVLTSYAQFSRDQEVDARAVEIFVKELSEKLNGFSSESGGTIDVSRQAIRDASSIDFHAFANSRHSVRNFTDEEVSIEAISEAVSLARKTPSVCNRQHWRVHVYSNTKDKSDVLRFQNGNSGFGHDASRVLVVTSDLRFFASAGERYQSWIDGGMFSMSLLYALHSIGLGACPLNWSVPASRDQAMRKRAGIPDNEVVLMMMAVGNLPAKFRVAASHRRPVDEILIWH
jgi:nitroreductase